MSQENTNYRWINKRTLAKETEDAKLPRSKRISFKAGTVSSVGKGLAVSVLTKIIDFEGLMDPARLKKLFRLGKTDYIGVKGSKRSITVKLRPGQRVKLDSKPFNDEHFPDLNFWDEKIEWHQCPDNLVEGIAYIEDIVAKGQKYGEKDPFFGIHVDGNYVGRADPRSFSRFRLRSEVPFPMILVPVDIGRLSSRLKGRRLRRVAPYTIPDTGPGVIFDYGGFRAWNAALGQDRRNLFPEINSLFNFRIDNFLKLPRDIVGALDMIALNLKDEPYFRNGRAVITVKIGKEIRLSYGSYVTVIPVPKSRRARPIKFDINFSTFKKLVGKETYIGYENPDSGGESQGRLYLKDQQGEHMIPISNIKKR